MIRKQIQKIILILILQAEILELCCDKVAVVAK